MAASSAPHTVGCPSFSPTKFALLFIALSHPFENACGENESIWAWPSKNVPGSCCHASSETTFDSGFFKCHLLTPVLVGHLRNGMNPGIRLLCLYSVRQAFIGCLPWEYHSLSTSGTPRLNRLLPAFKKLSVKQGVKRMDHYITNSVHPCTGPVGVQRGDQ